MEKLELQPHILLEAPHHCDLYLRSSRSGVVSSIRNAVLNHFDGRCAITGMEMRELLIASHILPWHSHPTARLNVLNGISLSRLHDAAFDMGLISFDINCRLILLSKLKRELSQRSLNENFGNYEGESLLFPTDVAFHNEESLAEYRAKIFHG
jgi:putative restriction endonuclease